MEKDFLRLDPENLLLAKISYLQKESPCQDLVCFLIGSERSLWECATTMRFGAHLLLSLSGAAAMLDLIKIQFPDGLFRLFVLVNSPPPAPPKKYTRKPKERGFLAGWLAGWFACWLPAGWLAAGWLLAG